jgi:hypothetical protein
MQYIYKYNIIKQHCCIQYCINAKIKVAGTGMDGLKCKKECFLGLIGTGMDGLKMAKELKRTDRILKEK